VCEDFFSKKRLLQLERNRYEKLFILMSQTNDKYLSLSHLEDVPKRVDVSDLMAMCEQDRKERTIKIVKYVARMVKCQFEQSRGLGPEWDARHQCRQRIDRFATVSCATCDSSSVKDLLMSLYRSLAQKELYEEYCAIFKICHDLDHWNKKAATHTIWGPWCTKGHFQCRFPGQDGYRYGLDKPPRFFVNNALDSDPNNAQKIGVCCIHDGDLEAPCLFVGDAEALMVHQKKFHIWFCKNHRCKGLQPHRRKGLKPNMMGTCPMEGSWHDVEEHMKNCPWDQWDDNILTVASE